MSITILSSKASSPYDVGATELRQARKAMKELGELKVTKDTYKRAEDAKSSWNWNWVTGDDTHKEKIEKQTKLEKQVSKNLSSIAAANARNPDAVSPEILKEARKLEDQLDKRLILDYDNAYKAKAGSYEQGTYNAVSDEFRLDQALNGAQRDVIPLDKTQSFIDQFRKDERKLVDAAEVYDDPGSSKPERKKAYKEMAESAEELTKKLDLMSFQVGPVNYPKPGIADSKYWALPEGDPLKKPYEKQNTALTDLQYDFYFGREERVQVQEV